MAQVANNEPRYHHVVPQFFLRNFAVNEECTRIATVAKEGDMAIWMERSIGSLGFERDFYVHISDGRPISVETQINRTIETPISQSDTWAKIASGRTSELDRSDRAILYALVRHLEARTPHYLETANELSAMARDPDSDMPFTDEEREMYAMMRSNPEFAKYMFNAMATKKFDERSFDSAMILVAHSPIILRTSTTPTMAAPSPRHDAMALPLPGQVPYQLTLTVNPHTLVSVILGDFDGHFANTDMEQEIAIGINRTFALQFSHFPKVRHLVSNRDRLVEDMTWAPYALISDTPKKIVFKRTVTDSSSDPKG